jgi:hypothetical protein
MAVPHHAYLTLEMPGNNGTTITIHGSFSRSDNCDKEFQKIASKFGIKEEFNAQDVITNHKQPPTDNQSTKITSLTLPRKQRSIKCIPPT